MNPGPTAVLVVDDNDDITSMLALIIDSEADLKCVGKLASADSLASTLSALKPDIVLIDLTMPGRDPLDAIKQATSQFPTTRFIVLSGYDDQAVVERAVDQGAWGFVSKHDDILLVLSAIRTVAAGGTYFKP